MIMKILVVEDEPPILRGICNKIQKTNTNSTIHTCFNGQEAIDYLSHHPVDVVFTDINMPLLNGLELLEYIKKNYPHIITIILSGYQEFEYAQKAVKLGAYDYLLKPLDIIDLQKILGHIEETFNTTHLKQIFYAESPEVFSSLADLLPPLYLVSICVGSLPNKTSSGLCNLKDYWHKIHLGSLFDDLLTGHSHYWLLDSRESNEKFIVLSSISEAQLHIVTEKLSQYLASYLLPVTIGISNSISSGKDILTTHKSLSTELRHRILFGYSQVFYCSHKSSYIEYSLSSNDEKKLLYALETDNIILFKKEFLSILEQLEKSKISQVNLEAILNQIGWLCKKTNFIECHIHDLELDIYKNILLCYNYQELADRMVQTILSYHPQKILIASQDKDYLITQIEHFIQEHLTEPITNQVLSSHFALGPGYISKLFKAHKGISPTDYLLTLRIEKAKEMLIKDPDLLSKDIAQILGYSDPLYFSRVFKKVTGLYPSDFRKNYISENKKQSKL